MNYNYNIKLYILLMDFVKYDTILYYFNISKAARVEFI